jgi:putative membrane protein insertion efficiency factor
VLNLRINESLNRKVEETRVNAGQHILILGVRLYQWLVSPVLRVVFGLLARCRYEPSCSAYAIQALRVHGVLAGSWLALKRIGRCQPWGSCGHDPVPGKKFEVRSAKFETNPKSEDRKLIVASTMPTNDLVRAQQPTSGVHVTP